MGIFQFANPGRPAVWLTLAIPIIALFILKVRLRRQPVTTLLFWNAVYDEKRSRAWWQRLRHWLSLLVQLALLLLIVLALTDPLWSWQRAQQRRLIMIVDNSASMAAEEEGESRLNQAKRVGSVLSSRCVLATSCRLLPQVESLALRVDSRTISMDSCIRSMRFPKLTLLKNLTQAIELARQLLDQQDDRQAVIYVLTDGCDPNVEAMRDDPSLQVYGFGTPLNNVGITQFQARRNINDAASYQIMLALQNFSHEPINFKVNLRLNDQLMDVIPVKLDAEGTRTFFFEQASSDGERWLQGFNSNRIHLRMDSCRTTKPSYSSPRYEKFRSRSFPARTCF